MDLTIENILLIGSLLLFVSIIAGKASFRFGVPTLILFLAIGMIAGADGLGLYFDDPHIAQLIGIVSLNFILFSGGLDTDWKAVKPILWQGVTLSSLGVLLTAVTLGVFVWAVTDFTIYEGLLLGSIVSSTDAAAVFSILRSRNLALKSQLRPTLEMESGSNDPMAYVLTVGCLGLVVNQQVDFLSLIPFFLQQMAIGALAGIFFGKLSIFFINKIKLDFEGLYPVLVIALMFITFSTTDFIGGNGFLAIYLCAVYLGNQDFIHKRSILRVFDGLAWLMQIVLFLTLGLLVFPSEIIPIVGIGVFISLFLILIARPLSVFISLIPFRMRFRRRVYISWVGLRGAVPIVFATYPLIAGIEKADMIFNIVFFISVTSVLIQGTTLSLVAKWLHVALPQKVKQRSSVDLFLSERARTVMAEIEIPDDGYAAGREIVELHLPATSLIALINRQGRFIAPGGATVIEPGDVLIVVADNREGLKQVYDSLKVKRPDHI
jgi:potassium/hydrogen antiporter